MHFNWSDQICNLTSIHLETVSSPNPNWTWKIAGLLYQKTGILCPMMFNNLPGFSTGRWSTAGVPKVLSGAWDRFVELTSEWVFWTRNRWHPVYKSRFTTNKLVNGHLVDWCRWDWWLQFHQFFCCRRFWWNFTKSTLLADFGPLTLPWPFTLILYRLFSNRQGLFPWLFLFCSSRGRSSRDSVCLFIFISMILDSMQYPVSRKYPVFSKSKSILKPLSYESLWCWFCCYSYAKLSIFCFAAW